MTALASALNNSDTIEGTLKKRAMTAIYNAYFSIYQVGLICSSIIVQRRFFIFNGIMFYDSSNREKLGDMDVEKRNFLMMIGMSRSVSSVAATMVGSRKLSEVHRALAADGNLVGFQQYLTYSCVLRAKGRSWTDTAKQLIESTDRHSYYLRRMLDVTIRQFKEEVNTVREREELKWLFAAIRAKRDLKKDAPTSKLVNRILGRLESRGLFDNFDSEDEN